MTQIPSSIPTFVPQIAWYALTEGNVQPSIADSVPNAAYLSPSGGQNGVIGSIDGGVIYLAGTVVELDGGQKWLMWDAASTATADNMTIFNPYVVTGTPGRWIIATPPAPVTTIQRVTAGGSVAIAPSLVPIVRVVVNKTLGSPTALTLPPMSGLLPEQQFDIFDGKGDAATNIITVLSGDTHTVVALILTNKGSVSLVWDAVDQQWLTS